MNRTARIGVAALSAWIVLMPGARAQDPAVVNAKTVRVKLDNSRVRVLEATLHPGDREQPHSHPAVVIYVIEGGRSRNHLADGTTTDMELKPGDVIYRDS